MATITTQINGMVITGEYSEVFRLWEALRIGSIALRDDANRCSNSETQAAWHKVCESARTYADALDKAFDDAEESNCAYKGSDTLVSVDVSQQQYAGCHRRITADVATLCELANVYDLAADAADANGHHATAEDFRDKSRAISRAI